MQIRMSAKSLRFYSVGSWGSGGNACPPTIVERRKVEERRKLSLWAHINTSPNYHRRRFPRRECDRYNNYIDWYKPALFYVTVGILLLSCVDAALTLYLLSHGAVELNPFMAFLIDINPQLFVIVKLGLTGIGLILLIAHINFRIFNIIRVDHCLYLSLFIYLALASYETLLVCRVPDFAAHI